MKLLIQEISSCGDCSLCWRDPNFECTHDETDKSKMEKVVGNKRKCWQHLSRLSAPKCFPGDKSMKKLLIAEIESCEISVLEQNLAMMKEET